MDVLSLIGVGMGLVGAVFAVRAVQLWSLTPSQIDEMVDKLMLKRSGVSGIDPHYIVERTVIDTEDGEEWAKRAADAALKALDKNGWSFARKDTPNGVYCDMPGRYELVELLTMAIKETGNRTDEYNAVDTTEFVRAADGWMLFPKKLMGDGLEVM